MINKVILVGNLGKNPEIRYAQNGNAVASISVATSESWTDKNTGQKQEKTEWHKVSMFGKLAEIAGQYLTSGSQVYIEGKLQTRKYQDKQTGADRYSTEIIADTMKMLGGKPQQQNGYQQPQQAQQMQQSMQQPQQGNYQQPIQQAQQRPQQGGNMAYPNPAHQPQPPQYVPNDFDDDVPF